MKELPITLPGAASNNSNSVLDIIKSGQGLLDIFAGKSGTNTSSETTQTALSPEAVNALLNQILGGTQGLATVASGQKAAGLYNSNVHTLLTNDLLSRAAGEVAVKSAPTTRTGSTATVQNPQMSLGKTLGGLALSIGGKKAFSASGADKSVDNFFSNLFKDKTFDPNNVDLEDASLGSAATSFVGGDAISNIASSSGDVGSNFIAGSLNNSGFSLSADALDQAGLFGSLGPDVSSGVGDAAGESFADSAGEIGGEAVGDAVSGGVPVVGPIVHLLQGDVGGAAGSAVGGAIGSAIFPGVGTVIGSTLGGALGGKSVICTECYSRGDMSFEYYKNSTEYGNTNSIARAGYHIWGIPAVTLMKKSKTFYAICRYLANSYASYISGNGNIIGAMIIGVGYPICYTLGWIKQQWHKQVSTPAL